MRGMPVRQPFRTVEARLADTFSYANDAQRGHAASCFRHSLLSSFVLYFCETAFGNATPRNGKAASELFPQLSAPPLSEATPPLPLRIRHPLPPPRHSSRST
eukprot:3608142-Rhodomonas_salina.1